MENYEEIKENVFGGAFATARSYLDLTNFEELDTILTNLAYDDDDQATDTVYYFLNYLILENESPELHNIASKLMGLVYCWREGAYHLGLQHLRRAIELAPNNLDYKEAILFFYDVPGQLLSTEDAVKYSKEVIKSNPNVEVAKRILAKHASKA